MLRNLVHVALLVLPHTIQQLCDLARRQLSKLFDRVERRLLLLKLDDEFRRDVRELEELGRGRVDGLQEELLQVDDGDVGRQPVVGEGDRGETGTEREGDRGRAVHLCREMFRDGISESARERSGAESDVPLSKPRSVIGKRRRYAAMKTRARFFAGDQLAYPSQPFWPSGPSRTVETSRAYSSVAVLLCALRSLSNSESKANSSEEARMSSSCGKVVSSFRAWKYLAAVELSTPSLVNLRVPYHQRPCAGSWVQLRKRRAESWEPTHDEDGQHDTEQQSVRANDDRRVLAFDDPGGQGDSGRKLLLAVGVTVQLVVPSAHFVGQSASLNPVSVQLVEVVRTGERTPCRLS